MGTLEAGAGQEQEGAKEGLQGRSETLADLATAHGPPQKKFLGKSKKFGRCSGGTGTGGTGTGGAGSEGRL